jgi:hypothetical protein
MKPASEPIRFQFPSFPLLRNGKLGNWRQLHESMSVAVSRPEFAAISFEWHSCGAPLMRIPPEDWTAVRSEKVPLRRNGLTTESGGRS